MQVITELELRRLHTNKALTSYTVPADTLVTPAALQFARDNGIDLIRLAGNTQLASNIQLDGKTRSAGNTQPDDNPRVPKPEEMTHLDGDTLVHKTHPRVKFRGRVDSLQAQLLTTIIESRTWGIKELTTDLEDILKFLRELIKAEVTGNTLSDISFRGWTMQDIREKSHHPEKHFGLRHLLPSPDHGLTVARLNVLRTLCRETELACVDAFYHPESVTRQDLVKGLNRLSSLFYIMMIMLISGHYKVNPV